MKKPDRDRARGLALRGAILLFIGALGLSGCGDGPAAGTVKVPAETHARLQPRNILKGKLGSGAPGKAADIKPVNK
jgi:hypothetical protein